MLFALTGHNQTLLQEGHTGTPYVFQLDVWNAGICCQSLIRVCKGEVAV